jgi:hypothetical protein
MNIQSGQQPYCLDSNGQHVSLYVHKLYKNFVENFFEVI